MLPLRCVPLVVALACGLAAQSATFPLDPRATYLRTNNDSPAAPLVVALASLPAAPGTWLRVGTVGAFRHVSGGQDTTRSLCAVFSNGSQVLASSVQHRVPGALRAGPSFPGANTYHGALPTDIPEDFFASRTSWSDSVLVEVPPGATHLIAGVHDSLYNDNVDPNGDFAAVITVLGSTPLPGTGEHFELRTGVAGAATAFPADKPAPAGSALAVELHHPIGFAEGAVLLLAAEVSATGAPVVQPLPRLWLGASAVLLQIGAVPAMPGWFSSWSVTAPPGFAGTTLLVQGGALTTIAQNGAFETTIAHRFLLQ